MQIPEHRPVSPGYFQDLLADLLADGGCRSATRFNVPHCTNVTVRTSGLTRVPYLVIPLAGDIRVLHETDGQVQAFIARRSAALFFRSGSWVYCDLGSSRRWLRITFDSNCIVFGCSARKVRGAPHSLDGFIGRTGLPAVGLEVLHDLDRNDHPGPTSTRWRAQVNFLLELLAEYCAKAPAGRNKARLTFDMACEYVKGNPGDSLTRERAALAVGVTPNHLSKLFKAVGATTFVDYVNDVRLCGAMDLLRSSLLTVSEIAFRSGFSDPNYFSRAFRKKTGMTPVQYRASAPGR